MPYSNSSTTSSSLSAGFGVSDGSSSASTTYATYVEASSPDDSGGLYAGLSADAVAVGDDTLTLAGAAGTMSDEGAIATVHGAASALAASQTSSDTAAFADAMTSASVAGAEFVYGTTTTSNATQQTASGTTAIATSTSTLQAYDLQPAAGDTGQVSTGATTPIVDGLSNLDPSELSDASVELDGNVAQVDFFAEAIGDDTLVLVDAFALTIADELSVSTVFVELAVG